MKKLLLSFALIPLVLLTACGKEKKVVVIEEEPTKCHRTERVSGPLSDKEVAWEDEDLE